LIYELIHSNLHNNCVALYRCEGFENNYFKKVALSNEGNKSIINESKGYDYFSNISGNKIKVNLNTETIYEINIPEIPGTRFRYNYSFPMNINVIENVIKFYKKSWMGKSTIGIHGDFALSNIILAPNNEIYIIDWEHFHLSSYEYWGFDIIHLIFLTIYQRSNRILNHEINFLKKCYNSLCEGISEKNKILEKPFVNSQKYMLSHENKFNVLVPITKKFILADFSVDILEKLDLMIT